MTTNRARRTAPAIFIVILIAALLGGTVWLIAELGRTSHLIRQEDLRQLAMHHVCDLVGTYVERSDYTRWPRSWEDLLEQAETGGYTGGWSPARPRLQDLVIVDFDADIKTVQQQEPTEFTAVRPAAGAATANVLGDISELLARIRGPVSWQNAIDPKEPK